MRLSRFTNQFCLGIRTLTTLMPVLLSGSALAAGLPRVHPQNPRYFTDDSGQRTKTEPKLNSSEIAEELQGVLARYRAGEIGEPQAKLEQAVLQSMLKAIEQTELAVKLERLEAVVRSRR